MLNGQQVKSLVRRLLNKFFKCFSPPGPKMGQALSPDLSSVAKAIQWLKNHELPNGGIQTESGYPHAYPEVTGYIIPTLLEYGQQDFAERLLKWLTAIQREAGCFVDPVTGIPFVFDTGQALRGLMKGAVMHPRLESAARRAAMWLKSQMIDAGRKGYGKQVSMDIPESIHLYTLPPLLEAARHFHDEELEKMVFAAANFYLTLPDSLQLTTLTHFLAYEIEALIDLGLGEKVQETLQRLQKIQKADGSIAGFSGVDWVCTPGLVQIGICFFKTGNHTAAEACLEWVSGKQHASGGFHGSYGIRAAYKQLVEIPWAVKYFLDAQMLSFKNRGRESQGSCPEAFQRVLTQLQTENRPGLQVAVIGEPPGASGISAGFFPRGNVRFCTRASDEELVRNNTDLLVVPDSFRVESDPVSFARTCRQVLSPCGKVVLIPSRPFPVAFREEQTKAARGLESILAAEGIHLEQKQIPGSETWFWAGKAADRMTAKGWQEAISSREAPQKTIANCRFGHISEWGQAIFDHTAPGEEVLEVGSGTGEISLQLALSGRKVTCLDFSREKLDDVLACAKNLGTHVEVLHANAEEPLKALEGKFDLVWSSGFLEHYGFNERVRLLSLWSRYSKNLVITMVPNARSLAYRAGKCRLEMRQEWPYGFEIPLKSLRHDYEQAHLELILETTVGEKHSLEFLASEPMARETLASFFSTLSPAELKDLHQGYLLVTVGRVKK